MTSPEPLDADQVSCPRCGADPGEVCRTPAGKVAKRVHEVRIAEGRGDVEVTASSKRPSRKKSDANLRPPTAADRAKGGKATAAARKRRAEQLEADRAAAEREAIKAKAERLAEDAARWDERRMALRSRVLERALEAWEAVDYRRLRTLQVEEDGTPKTYVQTDAKGEPKTYPLWVGDLKAGELRELMVAAAVALDKVRLEEGAVTNRTGVVREGEAEPISDEILAQLVERAGKILPP